MLHVCLDKERPVAAESENSHVTSFRRTLARSLAVFIVGVQHKDDVYLGQPARWSAVSQRLRGGGNSDHEIISPQCFHRNTINIVSFALDVF